MTEEAGPLDKLICGYENSSGLKRVGTAIIIWLFQWLMVLDVIFNLIYFQGNWRETTSGQAGKIILRYNLEHKLSSIGPKGKEVISVASNMGIPVADWPVPSRFRYLQAQLIRRFTRQWDDEHAVEAIRLSEGWGSFRNATPWL